MRVHPNICFEFALNTTYLWYALISVNFYLDTGGWRYKGELKRAKQLSLTWNLMRKAVLINKGCKVTWLREVLMVRVQFCIHVMQGSPLMAGGGGQLLFVCGMVILWVGGRFVCGCRIL